MPNPDRHERYLSMKVDREIRTACLMLVLVLSACTPSSILGEDPEVTLNTSNGLSYSSALGSVSRQMCHTLDVTTLPADLPRAKLKKIASLAERNGFFSLPPVLGEPCVRQISDTEMLISSSCFYSSLEIASHGKRHRISWVADISARHRPELAELQEALKPYLDKLPPQQRCARL